MTKLHYRPRTSVFLAVALSLGLVGAAYAFEPQYECTTNGAATWEVVAVGPTSIVCPSSGGPCTEMDYTITALKSTGANQDHVAVLVAHDLDVLTSSSVNVYPPCDGDTVTSMGIRDCSTQAVRLNNRDDVGTYTLIVHGEAVATDSSIVIKKGKNLIEECRIVSLGTPPPPACDPKAQQAAKQVFEFDGCIVEIDLDPCTGEPGDARVVSGDCAIDSGPVSSLQLVINGTAQNVTVGEGWISSGENSCSTTLFRTKSYTTCTCTEASDCFVKNSDGTYICRGKGICP